MKVIFAGLCKTGTRSNAAALRQLGYTVYDWPEHFENHGEEWTRIMLHGATTDDFRRMYENVDAVTGIPACYFWEEILKAFPDAKIVLSMRENEDTWIRSMQKQTEAEDKWYFRLFPYLSPTSYRRRKRSQINVNAIFGCKFSESIFSLKPLPELLMRKTYRRQNADVIQNAPKDKLLIHSPRDGWKRLCEFIGEDVPNTPYPHENVGGEVMEELYYKDPTFQRVKREALFTVSVATALTLYFAYKLKTGSNPIEFALQCFRKPRNLFSALF